VTRGGLSIHHLKKIIPDKSTATTGSREITAHRRKRSYQTRARRRKFSAAKVLAAVKEWRSRSFIHHLKKIIPDKSTASDHCSSPNNIILDKSTASKHDISNLSNLHCSSPNNIILDKSTASKHDISNLSNLKILF
jgi:hypothetical protein